MPRTKRKQVIVFFAFLIAFGKDSSAQSCPAKQHPIFKIGVAPELASQGLSGRLIVMMSNQSKSTDSLAPSYGPDAHSVWVAANRSPDSRAPPDHRYAQQ